MAKHSGPDGMAYVAREATRSIPPVVGTTGTHSPGCCRHLIKPATWPRQPGRPDPPRGVRHCGLAISDPSPGQVGAASGNLCVDADQDPRGFAIANPHTA